MCTWRDGVETVYAGNAADSLEAQGARDIWTSATPTRNWLRQYTEPDGCGLPFYQQDTMKYIVSLMTPIDLYHLKRVSSAFNFYAEEEIAARASKPEVIFKASDVDNYTNEGIHPPCDRLYCEVRNFSKKLFCVVSNRTKCITFDMRESNGAYINHMHDHFCTVLLVLQDVAPELRHITVRGGFMSVRAILETVEWINTLELEDVYVYGFRHLIPGYVHSDMSYLECGWMRTEKSYLKLNALFARGANQPHHVIHVAEELLDTFHLTSKDPLPHLRTTPHLRTVWRTICEYWLTRLDCRGIDAVESIMRKVTSNDAFSIYSAVRICGDDMNIGYLNEFRYYMLRLLLAARGMAFPRMINCFCKLCHQAHQRLLIDAKSCFGKGTSLRMLDYAL
ncbi:uncharacterized protein LOC129585596 [Paramacrobiotus metropolitanus]|nr:uncharacterized protein LOC129585596 [Paramacrobiotus metropolitanus]